jgi:hypothetical protein
MAVLLACGCDGVFDLDRVAPPSDAPPATPDAPDTPPDAPPFDACRPQPIDRSVRYKFVRSTVPYIQSTAIEACKGLGMEIVSINDAAELAALDAEIQQHAGNMDFVFISTNDNQTEGTWLGADGCAAHVDFGPAEPDGGALENCVAIDPDGMFDGPCSGIPTGGFANNRTVGCEVGRWRTQACLDAAMMPRALLFDTTARTADAAATFCTANGGTLIEIESSDELQAARTMAGGTAFWLGARHTQQLWRRASGIPCPQILPWRTGQPNYTGSECAAHVSGGAEIRSCTDLLATICEM